MLDQLIEPKTRLIFSVCDLQVMGYYLARTLHPIEPKLAPIRNIVYGVGSAFTLISENEFCAVIKDQESNKFTLSLEKVDTLFEEI